MEEKTKEIKLKLSILLNEHWASLPDKVKAVQQMFEPEVQFSITTQETNFAVVPFIDYSGQKRIDESWYQKNITPLAIGYDVVAFIVPTNQWLANNNMWGFKTWDKPIGQIEIGCDENQIFQFGGETQQSAFIYFLGHELRHYLMQFTARQDYDPALYPEDKYYVHYLDRVYKSKASEQFLKELDFVRPKTADKTYGWLLAIINFLKAFTDLKPDQEAQIREVAESYNPKPKNRIRDWAAATARHETNNFAKTTLPMRYNNPLALKYAGQSGARPGFNKLCIFDSYERGWNAGIYQLKIVANGTSNTYTREARRLYKIQNCANLNLIQFYSIWAPLYDNKGLASPEKYAQIVANELNIPTSTLIKTLL